MATRIQDQNLNVLYNGATPGGKINNAAKADKKGLGGGRKALNDISNSRRPSTIYSTKKQKGPHEARAKVSKVPEKGAFGVGSRKALTDLTNSSKPSSEHPSRAVLKFNTSAEGENVPSFIMEEGFLHDHKKCIKAQEQIKDVDIDYFLETVIGLKHGKDKITTFSSPKKLENSWSDPENISDLIFEVHQSPKLSDSCCSPVHQSPKPLFWEDDSILDRWVIDTPKFSLRPLNHPPLE